MILYDIYKMLKWHKKTFPNTTHSQQLDKVKSEIYEFTDAFEEFTQARNPKRRESCYRHASEELIDVIISSINSMRYPEVRELVKVKMQINKHRTFKNNHHITIDKQE